MASSNALSAGTQKAVLEQISLQHKANLKSAKNNGWLTLGGAAAYVAAATLLPVSWAAIPVMVASWAAMIGGAKLVGNLGRALTLHQIKGNVKDESFVAKLKKKASTAIKRTTMFSKLNMGTFIGVLAIGAAVAVSPLAAAVYPLAVGAMFATWAATDWYSGSSLASRAMAKFTYDRQVGEGAIRPAEDLLPPAPALAKSPASMFGIFASNNNEKKAEPKQAPQAPKNAAPKP